MKMMLAAKRYGGVSGANQSSYMQIQHFCGGYARRDISYHSK